MSSQMTNATVANKAVEITAGDYTLRASTSKVTFDGFLKLYNETDEEDNAPKEKIPDLNFNLQKSHPEAALYSAASKIF